MIHGNKQIPIAKQIAVKSLKIIAIITNLNFLIGSALSGKKFMPAPNKNINNKIFKKIIFHLPCHFL
jgi:hypothetical protein